MDKNLLEMSETFIHLAEELLSQAPAGEKEFDNLPKEWQEFFEECANIVNIASNLF